MRGVGFWVEPVGERGVDCGWSLGERPGSGVKLLNY